jgi:hypothetical protein
MDLRRHDDLVAVVEAIFLVWLRRFQILRPASSAALRPLTEPGRTYPSDELMNVDLNLLDKALGSVAEALSNRRIYWAGGRFNSFELQRALSSSKCHYLWFC